MAAIKDQVLPSKEASLFRQVVKFYESKQYKKGIKAADQILKRFPEHGETLAMKGLIIGLQEKAEAKAEAYEMVRRGLKANLQSHVCWHVYGLLWRADNNYDEATKCYKNALRFDKENLQILRDLAQLQIQTREYAGYIETRKTLLQLKSSNRQNWISLAIAHHLNEDFETAVKILNGFQGVQEGVPLGEEYEHSEMLLYKAMVLEEGGNFEGAWVCIEASQEHFKDQLSYLEAKARLLTKLERLSEAAITFRKLLALNPDNHTYHKGLRQVLGLLPSSTGAWSEQQQQELEQLYEKLCKEFPKSTTSRRMQLDFLDGEAFEQTLDAYVRKFLVKGIPSLFSDLKGLYSSSAKADLIDAVFKRILDGLESAPSILVSAKGQLNGQDEPGSNEALLWTRLFLSRHFDRLGNTEKALQLIKACEEQSPEVLEVYMAKAIVLKHAGDLYGAATACHKAQSLDQADRYLNCIAAKALFRAGEVEKAEKMAWRFISAADPANTMNDMQCMWYEIESGNAYLRRSDYGKALKNFLAVTKHFATFQEDQFDFHSYCMRKMTLRNYISLLRVEDTILENPNYAKAAYGAIETYLELANKGPRAQQSLEAEETLLASLSLEDRKKHKLKKKKDAQKKAKEEDRRKSAAAAEEDAKAKEAAKAGNKKQAAEKVVKDVDPDGVELAGVPDPLEEASKLLAILRENAGSRLKTHTLSFEVAMQRKKLLLALQAVKRSISLVGAEHPEAHRMIVLLSKEIQAAATSQANGHVQEGSEDHRAMVKRLLTSNLESILGSQSLEAYHENFLQAQARSSMAHRAVAAETKAVLKPKEKQQAISSLLDNDLKTGPASRQDHADAIKTHRLLKENLLASDAAASWKEKCRDCFPYSTYFEGTRRTLPNALYSAYGTSESNNKAAS